MNKNWITQEGIIVGSVKVDALSYGGESKQQACGEGVTPVLARDVL